MATAIFTDEQSSAVAAATFVPKHLLDLFLGLHDHGPTNDCWDYLTLSELWNLRLLSRSLHQDLKWIKYTKCRDGHDYQVPFPGFPGLLSTKRDNHGPLQNGNDTASPGLYSHQLASLAAMHRMENASQEFGSLRGGVSFESIARQMFVSKIGQNILHFHFLSSDFGRCSGSWQDHHHVGSDIVDGWPTSNHTGRVLGFVADPRGMGGVATESYPGNGIEYGLEAHSKVDRNTSLW